MQSLKRSDQLREVGLTPTIQRMAVLDYLDNTRKHPTADQVLADVRKSFPSVSRGTIYNTLEALTQAGLILRITVDPSVSRYDADLEPHAHFRCRMCDTVYDIPMDREFTLEPFVQGHRIEAVRAYAYGVCEKCLTKDSGEPTERLSEKAPKTTSRRNSPSEETQRRTRSFSNEPTREPSEKTSKMTSPSDAPSKKGGESPNARAS